MSRTKRLLITLSGAAFWALTLGFLLFANSVTREPELSATRADGIVVLTGGQTRIAEAARLLGEGRAKRLLISGVNQKIGRSEVLKISGLPDATFECCVDLGYEALDTVGNAVEARRWAERHGYTRLIVVTASYHMPRSIVEIAREMPGVELVPHPVLPGGLRGAAWWLQPTALRVLASEYLKFLPAAVRLAVARGVVPWQGTLAASAAGPSPRS